MVLYGALMHDAVVTWAYGTQQTLDAGYDVDNGTDITSRIMGSEIECKY